MRLEGRRALVTGGGRGIGRAVALAFAREGADVAVAARTRPEIESVAAEIESLGRKALALPCDVRRPEEIRETVRATAERLGEPDILVPNAGRLVHASVEEHTDEVWEDMLAVNLSGVFWAIRAVVGPMARRGWGRIIAVSSVSGKIGGAYRCAYHAAKHGVLGLVRSVALEVADRGVTVNAICPGYVETRMYEENWEALSRARGIAGKEEAQAGLKADVPMKRFLAPEEIASLAVFLASEDARGITGQAYTISGGAVQV